MLEEDSFRLVDQKHIKHRPASRACRAIVEDVASCCCGWGCHELFSTRAKDCRCEVPKHTSSLSLFPLSSLSLSLSLSPSLSLSLPLSLFFLSFSLSSVDVRVCLGLVSLQCVFLAEAHKIPQAHRHPLLPPHSVCHSSPHSSQQQWCHECRGTWRRAMWASSEWTKVVFPSSPLSFLPFAPLPAALFLFVCFFLFQNQKKILDILFFAFLVVRQPLRQCEGKGNMEELEQLATATLCGKLYTYLKSLVEECGGTYMCAPRKSYERCVQEVEQECEGDYSMLDVERGAVRAGVGHAALLAEGLQGRRRDKEKKKIAPAPRAAVQGPPQLSLVERLPRSCSMCAMWCQASWRSCSWISPRSRRSRANRTASMSSFESWTSSGLSDPPAQ